MDDWLATAAWVLLCLTVPIAWGVVVNRVFDFFTARRRGIRDSTPPEYHI